MMTWAIPAKTFLVGEYVALFGGPALVLTTSPCFELSLTAEAGLHDIHPESPAGRWWLKQGFRHVGLQWSDPYQACGGLGASSAQFLGAYLASEHLHSKTYTQSTLLKAYIDHAWHGQGLPPSGYDVIAQRLGGCVYINRQNERYESDAWPFDEVTFILLHTGQKIMTHHHLQDLNLKDELHVLSNIAESAHTAFKYRDTEQLISAVNGYYQRLQAMNLVAAHTIQLIESLKTQTGILAMKGCGALGADIVLAIVETASIERHIEQLSAQGLRIVGLQTDGVRAS